jgi:hypothetical protein
MKERDFVRMTQKALDQNMHKAGRMPIEPSSTGIVTSIRPPYVYVLRDGRKTVTKYHMRFWEVDLDRE